jgi:hypothetical protein
MEDVALRANEQERATQNMKELWAIYELFESQKEVRARVRHGAPNSADRGRQVVQLLGKDRRFMRRATVE